MPPAGPVRGPGLANFAAGATLCALVFIGGQQQGARLSPADTGFKMRVDDHLGSVSARSRRALPDASDLLRYDAAAGGLPDGPMPPLTDGQAALLLDAGLKASCSLGSADHTVCSDVQLGCRWQAVANACPHRCGTCPPAPSTPAPSATTEASATSHPRTDPATPSSAAADTIEPEPSVPEPAVATSSPPPTTPPADAPLSSSGVNEATLNHVVVTPPDEVFREEAAGRCGKEGCAMLFPGPERPPATSLADLLQIRETCLWQHVAVRLPSHQRFEELRAVAGASVLQCVEACLLDRACTGYVHFNGTIDPAGGDDAVRCVLYKGMLLHNFQLTRKRHDMRHCTAGFVRPGLPEIDFTEPPPKDVKGALRELPKAAFGQAPLYTVLDVHHCAAYGSPSGRYAIVSADDLQRPTVGMIHEALANRRVRLPARLWGAGLARNLVNSTSHARLARVAKVQGLELVKLVPAANATEFPLTDDERKALESAGFRVVLAPWTVPPNITFTHSKCAKQDFVRLNALALTEYDAVLVVDSDVTFFGDVRPLLRCASRNFMLSASGPMSPMNLGVWAFRPSAALLDTAVRFAQRAAFDDGPVNGVPATGGWGDVGFEPFGESFVGAGCGQGFIWTLFYKNGHRNTSDVLESAWRESAAPRPRAYQVDRCRWNFQGERTDRCDPGFRCEETRMAHKPIKLTKPTKDNQNGRGCFYHPGTFKYLQPAS